MELKSRITTDKIVSSDAFNRTAYGIEKPVRFQGLSATRTFNRTAYGIEKKYKEVYCKFRRNF